MLCCCYGNVMLNSSSPSSRLTWRDVQHLITQTANPDAHLEPSDDWITNAADLKFKGSASWAVTLGGWVGGLYRGRSDSVM